MKIKIYNLYCQPSKSERTCDCGQKKTNCFILGEYVHSKWRRGFLFCQHCFMTRIAPKFRGSESCTVGKDGTKSNVIRRACVIVPRSRYSLPDWIVAPCGVHDECREDLKKAMECARSNRGIGQ